MFSLKMSPIEVIKSYFGTQRGEGLNYYFDPMMHGPFLFHFQAAVFFILGLLIYIFKLPIIIGAALCALIAGSILLLKRKKFSSPKKKIWSSIGVIFLNLIFLFLIVSRFTGYSENKLAG